MWPHLTMQIAEHGKAGQIKYLLTAAIISLETNED